jgi:hypothetical protein
MTGERPPRRYPASAFPEIQGIRMGMLGGLAALVNLSKTGVLVESSTRLVPGTTLTLFFKGAFTPASMESRVVRIEVAGIAQDGSLRFHVGLAFNSAIELPPGLDVDAGEPDVAPLLPENAPDADETPALRNRW